MTIRKLVHVHVCVYDGGGIYLCMYVCVCVSGDGCPQHLSGNLAMSRALPMRAGKHAVMDLTLHTSAKHNVNLFPSLHSALRSSFFLLFLSLSTLNEPFHA